MAQVNTGAAPNVKLAVNSFPKKIFSLTHKLRVNLLAFHFPVSCENPWHFQTCGCLVKTGSNNSTTLAQTCFSRNKQQSQYEGTLQHKRCIMSCTTTVLMSKKCNCHSERGATYNSNQRSQ